MLDSWDNVAAGSALPERIVDITATHIVAGALATRDFMPVHHDKAYANAQGAPDIFMNILSSNAHCVRYLTDWSGADTMVCRFGIRLGIPVFPGTQLTFTGAVDDVLRGPSYAELSVSFAATSPIGTHLSGTATLRRPSPLDRSA